MSRINDHLLIGDYKDCQDYKFLKQNKITHILCAAGELEAAFPNEFTYKMIRGSDCPKFDLAKHFDEAADFIKKAIEKAGQVLVHCYAGVSRSTSCVIAYLIKHEGMNFHDALRLCRRGRSIVQPNPGFIEQLKEYAIRYSRLNKGASEPRDARKRKETRGSRTSRPTRGAKLEKSDRSTGKLPIKQANVKTTRKRELNPRPTLRRDASARPAQKSEWFNDEESLRKSGYRNRTREDYLAKTSTSRSPIRRSLTPVTYTNDRSPYRRTTATDDRSPYRRTTARAEIPSFPEMRSSRLERPVEAPLPLRPEIETYGASPRAIRGRSYYPHTADKVFPTVVDRDIFGGRPLWMNDLSYDYDERVRASMLGSSYSPFMRDLYRDRGAIERSFFY